MCFKRIKTVFFVFVRLYAFLYLGRVKSFRKRKKTALISSFGKKLVFRNILGFLEVNWVQKWMEVVNLGYGLLLLKGLVLKNCSEIVFII